MAEADVMRRCQIAMSMMGARVFRNNTGLGWVGKVERVSIEQAVWIRPGDVVVRNARPLHAGLVEGGSDLIGWSEDGKFVACEIKMPGERPNAEQQNFLNAINAAHGIAIWATSEQEIIEKYKEARDVR